ncbi:MAG: aspartate dehydrogenase [Candidatus Syntropharchaeia archaeon]
MIRIGVFGCGAIGTEICTAVDNFDEIEVVAIYDRHPEKMEKLIKTLKNPPKILKIDRMVEEVDLVVECASQSAVHKIALSVLEKGKDLMIMSVGALLDDELFKKIKDASERNKCRVYIPSGAIVGIDGLKSASVGKIESVTLTTRKPPSSLGVEEEEEKVLYEGGAREAVRLFPANVNVSASLSLAGIGSDRTRVKIVADPKIKRNIHEVEVVGEFGRFYSRVENVPSPKNPKTSFLAALSAIATLKKIANPIQIGT